jgi:hypothetical protein
VSLQDAPDAAGALHRGEGGCPELGWELTEVCLIASEDFMAERAVQQQAEREAL